MSLVGPPRPPDLVASWENDSEGITTDGRVVARLRRMAAFFKLSGMRSVSQDGCKRERNRYDDRPTHVGIQSVAEPIGNVSR
jgi:hypothetical protein